MKGHRDFSDWHIVRTASQVKMTYTWPWALTGARLVAISPLCILAKRSMDRVSHSPPRKIDFALPPSETAEKGTCPCEPTGTALYV